MHHYAEFDPYLIRERSQQIFAQVKSLRLERRLHKNHKARESRPIAMTGRLRGALHLLRKVGPAGR